MREPTSSPSLEEARANWIAMVVGRGSCDCCETAFYSGAAAAFGLMGMFEAIRRVHLDIRPVRFHPLQQAAPITFDDDPETDPEPFV